MFKIIILIYLSIIFTSVHCKTDYCDIERRFCLKKHIGCSKNVFNSSVEPYEIQEMTDNLKEIILRELNKFRSKLTNGFFSDSGYPQATNMRMIRWNNEFEYLAKLSIKKLSFDDYSACVATEKFQRPLVTHNFRYHSIIAEDLFQNLIRNLTSSGLVDEVSEFIQANIYQVGCAYGNLTNEFGKVKNIVKCIYDDAFLKPIQFAYIFGFPCLNCSMWNETCNHEQNFPGLCVPINYQRTNSAVINYSSINLNYKLLLILILFLFYNYNQ